MKPSLSALILTVPALLIGAAVPSSAARDRDVIPLATPTGPARDCVSVRALGSSTVRSDRVIDFVDTGRRGYRVTLPNGCPGLGQERAFAYSTTQTQLCRQDIITVLYQDGGLRRGASCGLAPFQPVEFAKRR